MVVFCCLHYGYKDSSQVIKLFSNNTNKQHIMTQAHSQTHIDPLNVAVK